jgi:uncharacterized protein YdgA (DUF945 family)
MRIRIGKYVVVLVLLLIAAAILPGAAGYYFKNNYLALLNSMNADSPTKIKLDEYSLGWLHSTAKLSVTFKQRGEHGGAPTTQTISMNQIITHGPMIKDPATQTWIFMLAMINTQVHIDKKMETNWLGANSDNGVMQITTMANFLGNYASQLQTPLFTFKSPNDVKFSWQGMKGSVDADTSNNVIKKVKTDLTASPFSMQDTANGNSLTLQGMTVQAEKTCDRGALCTGTGSATMPVMVAVTPDRNLKVSGITMSSSYGADAKNVFTGKLQMGFAKYEMPDYTVGPMVLKLGANNIDGNVLQKIIALAKNMPADLSSDSRADQLILVTQYNAEIPHLILANTVFTEDASVKTSYGDFKSTGKFSWPANTPMPNTVTDLIKMNVTMNVQAATALVDQIISELDAKDQAQNPTAAAEAVAAAGPQTFENMINLMVAKGLSTDEQKNLLELNKKHVTKQVFNNYVDSRVAVKLIPPSMSDQIKNGYNPNAVTSAPSSTAATTTSNKELDDWVKDKKITDDTRDALNELQKQHFSSVIYDSSIDDLIKAKKLTPEFGAQLKKEYDDSSNSEVIITGDADTATQAATLPAAPAGRFKMRFDGWIKQGLVKQDKDNYVVDIIYEKSVLTINGVNIPLPPQNQ